MNELVQCTNSTNIYELAILGQILLWALEVEWVSEQSILKFTVNKNPELF